MDPKTGANDFTLEELEALFRGEDEQATPPVNNEQEPDGTTEPPKVDETKAFAKRLKESTEKVRLEERNAIAVSLGYKSFEEMQQKREQDLLKDKGLDPDEIAPVVDEIVKTRLDNDPRIKEFAKIREQQVVEFGKKELAEISKLTNGEITKFEQLPKEVVELWKTKGSLKAAYLEVKGEELILKARSEQNRGSTDHLNLPSGNPAKPTNERPLTEEEKRVWKIFKPGITDEELNKKTVKGV